MSDFGLKRFVPLALALCLGACGVFGSGDDTDLEDETGSDDDGEDESGDDGPVIPVEGFRVFPKYMLVDVPAVVTIEENQVLEECPLDDIDGGYLCDADSLSGTFATIKVERDGFDPAVRNPEIDTNQLVELDVHLNFEGGATGSWSACAPAGDFDTCDALCGNEMLVCTVADCATEDLEWPVATRQDFAAEDCLDEPIESFAEACDVTLPEAGGTVASVRCCCAEG